MTIGTGVRRGAAFVVVVLAFIGGVAAHYLATPPPSETCATLLVIPKGSNWEGPYLPVGELRYCGVDLRVEFE